MKRMVAVLLSLITVFLLCACGSDGLGEASSKNAPSEELVLEDLTKALQNKNPYATIKEVETIKSLTGEDTYELNVQVFAETKYANLTYEATMDYTKYDQGWIVDNVSWIVKTQDVRCPEIDEMTGCVKSYLSTHEYYRDDWFADSQVAMDNLTIEKSDAVNNEDFIVELNWTSIQKLKHGEKWYSFNSLWKYDDINDNWTLLPDDEDWYHFDSKLISFSPDYTLDFSGEWSYLNQGTLVIENFSWDGFDLRIAELSDPAERFEYEKKDYDFSSRTYLGDDSSVRFNFYEEYTEILWHGNPYYVYARVSEDLPKLS